jgi:glutamate dehydrogenase (NADP+)
VQHSSAIGPFKGGMRFYPSVNLSIPKFLAAAVMDWKNVRRGRLSAFAGQHGLRFEAGKRPWHVPVDVALPCATQNELDEADARTLVANGVKCVAEGANIAGFVKVADAMLAQGVY